MKLLNRLVSIVCSASLVFSAVGFVENDFKGYSATKVISDEIGLVCNLFTIDKSGTADNAALQWATTLDADSYTLYRSDNPENNYTEIYKGTGTSFEDNNLKLGDTYYYQLKVEADDEELFSSVKSITPEILPQGLSTYDNQKGSNLVYSTSGYKVGDTYYRYSLKSHSGQNDIYLAESVSSDGRNFGNERNVADSSQNADLSSCKIESIHIEYVPEKNKVVVWAHWEKPSGYNDGKALVITGTPGGKFTVHHVYNPLGIQVRDMAVFFDDDTTGYLIAAANKEGQGANATIYIFKMNDDYSDVTEITKTLFENQYREFPNMIKQNGYYFLFTSQAAGWYPSSGAYSVTDNIAGEWSELRNIGNTSTFSSQSGWVVNLQNKNYLMHAYRWLRASSTSGTTLCPLYFDNSFAFYDYYPSFQYSTDTGALYPVHKGELLSQNKPATASIASKETDSAAKAFDGSYRSAFVAIGDYKKWPFYIQVDLEEVCDLANIQTSWYICKGSEGYYTYTVEGSTDGENWTQLLDHTDKNSDVVNSTYGFNSNMLSGRARYVRLNVKNATLHNNPNNNWYTPTVYEIKIYGTPVEKSNSPTPVVKYDFEVSHNMTIPDVSGSGNALRINGNASIYYDEIMGKILALDGTADSYAQLPDGILDGCTDYTIVMDAKSDSTGDFFTFALGQDNIKYAFFKIARDHFRFATTLDTWRGESGLRHDLDAASWHKYVFVVKGATAELYIDGKLAAHTAALTTLAKDMGSSLLCYIGKSFYPEDTNFKGSIDNLSVYRTALNPDEVAELSEIAGDVNGDGDFNAADLVCMSRFLLAADSLRNWQAGDLIKDNQIDVFDLSMMRKLLICR